MKKLLVVLSVLLTLVIASSVFAEGYGACDDLSSIQDWADKCVAGGGTPQCNYEDEEHHFWSSRCDISTEYVGHLPLCSDGSVGVITLNPNTEERWSICPQGTTVIGWQGYGPRRIENILPPIPYNLWEAVEGPVGDTPYAELIDVPEGKIRIFLSQDNRGKLRFDSEKILGWTADLNRIIYAVSKQCFSEALAEKPMMYNIINATQQADGQYWMKLSNENPILVDCSLTGTVTPEQLAGMRFAEPWRIFERIKSVQGNPWLFRPIMDEDGNVVEPSPKLGFELK